MFLSFTTLRRWRRGRHTLAMAAVMALSVLAGCATIGPADLQRSRLDYNEVVKVSAEEQLLLNIIRLRYGESPSSLAISAIAAQFEREQSGGVIPFFTASGADVNKAYTSILPTGVVTAAERPTFSLTPMDDQDFARKLFTPLPRDALLYLAKTTWPISTVFRLFLQNLNWVKNGQSASGPTPATPPEFKEFRRGIDALAGLQEFGWLVFGQDERFEPVGAPLRATDLKAADLVALGKAKLELRQSGPNSWTVGRTVEVPVLRFSRQAKVSEQMEILAEVFGIRPGLDAYDFTLEKLTPFRSQLRDLSSFDIETRSMLQAWYFAAHGVEVPEEHLASGVARRTIDSLGRPFDWSTVTEGLFRVRAVRASQRPASARIAVPYRDHWYYIDDTDAESKSTFALLNEVSRIELSDHTADNRPVLTLPVGGG